MDAAMVWRKRRLTCLEAFDDENPDSDQTEIYPYICHNQASELVGCDKRMIKEGDRVPLRSNEIKCSPSFHLCPTCA